MSQPVTNVSLNRLLASAAAVAALAIMGGLVPACGYDASPAADVPIFELPEWRGLTPEYGDQFSLRREAEGAGALLLKHGRRDVVYKYDPDRRTLTAAGGGKWQQARGAVAQCNSQFPKAELLVTQAHKLLAGGKEIPAAGKTVLSVGEAPGGKLAAVLSASGEVAGSVIPFSEGGGASGDYYHQLLSLPGMTWVGAPVRVPSRHDTLIPCWSADEQFVVYRQTNFNYLSIIRVESSSTSTSSTPAKVQK